MLGFLDALCGPKASELKVKDMEKYAFDPRRLLVQIASIMIRVWKQDKTSTAESSETFLMSLATHPDFENQTMSKCGSVLQKQVLSGSDVLGDYTSLMQQVCRDVAMTSNTSTSNLLCTQIHKCSTFTHYGFFSVFCIFTSIYKMLLTRIISLYS